MSDVKANQDLIEVDTERDADFLPPPEEVDTEQVSDKGEDHAWTVAAVKDERRKRQGVESRNRELEQRISRMEGQISERATQAPVDEGDDPVDYSNLEGWARRVAEKQTMAAVSKLKKERAEERHAEWVARVNECEIHAQDVHEDYLEVREVFKSLAEKNPSLWNRMKASPDPAEFAYRHAKKHGSGGEVEALKARIAELESPGTFKKKTRLAAARGSGSGPTSSDGDSEGSIFGDALGGR